MTSVSTPSAAPAAAPDFLEAGRERVEQALAQVVEQALADLPAKLRPAVAYALSTSGKRIRPILCCAAYAAACPRAEVPAAVYRLSCALEIVHTYSLVHDDLPCMDDDDLRRGRATVHKVFGNANAMLAGAALLPIAIQVLDREGRNLSLDAGMRGALATDLMRAAGAAGMVGGQLMDLQGEGRRVDADELESIHRRKTGALLVSSLRVGAMAGGAEPALLEALTDYGSALGLAFQIADDVLDVAGCSESLGKTAGRDIELEKASYPSLYGIDGARELARAKANQAKAAVARYDLPELAALADYVVERRQ